jgi:hypothetical protein
MMDAFIAAWEVLRLVVHRTDNGWRVYAFETDGPEPEQRTDRGITYPTLDSAKAAALETATELLGWGITAQDLDWIPVDGPLPRLRAG